MGARNGLRALSRRLSSSGSPSPSPSPSSWLDRSFLPERLAQASVEFAESGCAVLDNVLAEGDARALRDNVRELFRVNAARVTPNSTFVVDLARQQTSLFPKAHIHEYDYVSAGPSGLALLDSIASDVGFSSILTSVLKLDDALVAQNVKVQKNDGGGGCFPIHFDTDGSYDTRMLSCILYLNEEPVGGELVLYPYTKPRMIVEPTLNRMVVFRSDTVAHRVLPSLSERYCLTIWCSSRPTHATVDEFEKEKTHLLVNALQRATGDEEKQTIRDAIEALPVVQKTLTKLVLQDEWRASLIESHAPSPERDALLASFDAELEHIRSFARMIM